MVAKQCPLQFVYFGTSGRGWKKNYSVICYLLHASRPNVNYAGEFCVDVRRKSRNTLVWQILGMLV
jgi:hypothetical protein